MIRPDILEQWQCLFQAAKWDESYALCILIVTVKEKPKDNVGQRLSFTAIGGYDLNSAILDI